MNKQYKAGSEPIIVREIWHKVKMKQILLYENWLNNTDMTGRWCMFISENSVYFEDEADATLFKLRWL